MLYDIELTRMEFRAYHGCYDLEQQVGNRFTVDLVITAELGDAAERDDVTRTVNYLTVYETVRRQMGITQRTIERVAANIIEALYADFARIREGQPRRGGASTAQQPPHRGLRSRRPVTAATQGSGTWHRATTAPPGSQAPLRLPHSNREKKASINHRIP